MDARTELMLMLAARAQHVTERLRPWLDEDLDVVVDRYSGSTLAYQGYGAGPAARRRSASPATSPPGGLWPDLTILLDVPLEAGGARRTGARRTASRPRTVEFHERVRQGYLELAAADPPAWVVIDGSGDPEEVAARVRRQCAGGSGAPSPVSSEPLPTAPVLERIVGQPRAVRILRASVRAPCTPTCSSGRPGAASGRRRWPSPPRSAARTAAAGSAPPAERHSPGAIPTSSIVERAGASISAPQAREVSRLALRSPRAAPYQVLVLVDFHLVEKAGPVLLKTIEEPPDTTVIIVLADYVPAELVTIASRCLSVEFDPLAESDIVAVLSREDVGLPAAEAVAQVARGRLDRARLLARDEGFSVRMERWRQIPGRLDGTGATSRPPRRRARSRRRPSRSRS